MSAEDFKRRRTRLSKRKIRLSQEEYNRRYKEYHRKTITCPLCGDPCKLRFQRDGDPRHQYFYCDHVYNTSIVRYIGRIEDVEELLNPPKETDKQATLGLTNSFAGNNNS